MFEIVQRSFHHRHFWRHISFSELAELYVSIMLRVMALSLIGIFIPIYLYQLGHSLFDISIFYVILYSSRLIIDPLMQMAVIGWGAKHVIRMSYLLLIITLGLLILIEGVSIPLWLLSLALALATGAFYMPFHLEFSVLKSTKHEGRQLGWLWTLEKISGALGPLVGGTVATYFGIQYVLSAAIVLMVMATVPLFITKETIKTKRLHRLQLSDYWRYLKHLPAMIGRSADLTVSSLFWPLFVGLFILERSNVYAGLGLIVTLSLIGAIIGANICGKLIDKNKGGSLLRYSSLVSSFASLLRPFITSFQTVLVLNPVAELFTNGIGMAYSKGFYDASDSEGSKRMSFVTVIDAYAHTNRALLWAVLAGLTFIFTEKMSLQIIFVICSLLILLLNLHRFKVLK